MRSLTFQVGGVPAPQGSKRAFIRAGRPVIVDTNHDRLALWRNDVVVAGERARRSRPTITDPVAVDLVFTFPRPRSHYGSGRNATLLRRGAPHHHTTTPDIDKLARAVNDALVIAGVIADDKQISDLHASKHYLGGEASPGVRVQVIALDEPAGAAS